MFQEQHTRDIFILEWQLIYPLLENNRVLRLTTYSINKFSIFLHLPTVFITLMVQLGMINFLSFHLFENTAIVQSLVKDMFAGYNNLVFKKTQKLNIKHKMETLNKNKTKRRACILLRGN